MGLSWRQSHLEDSKGFLVGQNGAGVPSPSLRILELVDDLDSDIGEAVLLTELEVESA